MKYIAAFILLLSCAKSPDNIKEPTNQDTNTTHVPTNLDKVRVLSNELTGLIDEINGLPLGSLGELVVLSNEDMILFDRTSNQLHHFDKNGEYINLIADEGRGPGEIPPLTIMEIHNNGKDTLILASHFGGGNQSVLVKNSVGSFSYSHSFVEKPQAGKLIRFLSPNYAGGYFITHRKGFSREYVKRRKIAVEHLNMNSDTITDSLYILHKINPLIDFKPGELTRIGAPPYGYEDFLKGMPNGDYLFAQADSALISIYDSNHNLKKNIPISFTPRAITQDDLDINFDYEGVDKKGQKKIMSYVDEYKPPFLQVWVSKSFLWLHTDNTAMGKELVIMDFGGNIVGKTYIDYFKTIKHVTDQKIYTLNRNPKEDYSVRIYAVSQ